MSDRVSTKQGSDAWNACLVALKDLTKPYGEYCVTFAPIEQKTDLPRNAVRRAVRSLARSGLAEFHSPLWDDDGVAGAGYCITPDGQKRAAEVKR